MNRSLLDFWVGIFLALGIAATVFLALRVANQSSFVSPQTYSVYASFTNVGGLKVRAPVKSAGVTVGRVSDIRLDPGTYQAKVTLDINSAYQFSIDSSASILTSGLLGEQYIGLEVGGETDMLQAGDSIEYTSSALVLENLIGKFMLGSGGEKSSGEKSE